MKPGDLVKILDVEDEELKPGDIALIVDTDKYAACILTCDGKKHKIFLTCLTKFDMSDEK
jgi:hypothetical protein